MKMPRVRFLPRAPVVDPGPRSLTSSLVWLTRRERVRIRQHRVRQPLAQREDSMLSDFKKFVLLGNVVDLAVAVVVGVAFTAMITAFVADLITPLIAAIFGKPNFSA